MLLVLTDSPSDGGASCAGAAGLSSAGFSAGASAGASAGGAGVWSGSTRGSAGASAGVSAGASVLSSPEITRHKSEVQKNYNGKDCVHKLCSILTNNQLMCGKKEAIRLSNLTQCCHLILENLFKNLFVFHETLKGGLNT